MPKCSFGIEGTMHEEVLTFMEKTRQCVDAPIGQMNFYSNVFTLVLSIVGLVVLIPPIRYMYVCMSSVIDLFSVLPYLEIFIIH